MKKKVILIIFSSYGTDNAPAVLDDVQCSTAEYLVLLQCAYSTNIGSDCSDGTDATVTCCKSLLGGGKGGERKREREREGR